mmetsp:Transcript_20397/g.57386  ORF Transcript_20397/g.57386 Transcript_20397/m.57386 type:complete len:549 (+) Transcript_20397:3-1649(+)
MEGFRLRHLFCNALQGILLATQPDILLGTSVWPPPQSMSATGPLRPLHPLFQIHWDEDSTGDDVGHDLLQAGMARYDRLIRRSSAPVVDSLRAIRMLRVVVLRAADVQLDSGTNYSYSLLVHAGNDIATITAGSVYGALYGAETFAQLVDADGFFAAASVVVRDEPQYKWRGLLIDSGRRFFPVPLVKNLLDTMSYVKMNVLHLHASDNCRFAIESKLYPQLTASLTGDRGGFYTQADIKEIIAYAKQRGIRVVPEFDIPGHSRGLIPLESEGMKFCTSSSAIPSQLYNDPGNETYAILSKLFEEMVGLFEDEVFNIGCDETQAQGNCTEESMFELEREMVQTLVKQYDKTPEGWEEILYVEHAATQDTIVNAWSAHNASSITNTGRRAVESASAHFYFTDPAPAGSQGLSRCHYDIGFGVPCSQRHLLLGGEVSMWSDRYCNVNQCGAYHSPQPVGHVLFPPSADEAFAKSVGGMIWPRGYVAAASFWNFNASANASSPEFAEAVNRLNDAVVARGSLVCPSQCSCDVLSACGVPYLNGTSIEIVEV